jgi:hypothetical protein
MANNTSLGMAAQLAASDEYGAVYQRLIEELAVAAERLGNTPPTARPHD